MCVKTLELLGVKDSHASARPDNIPYLGSQLNSILFDFKKATVDPNEMDTTLFSSKRKQDRFGIPSHEAFHLTPISL